MALVRSWAKAAGLLPGLPIRTTVYKGHNIRAALGTPFQDESEMDAVGVDGFYFTSQYYVHPSAAGSLMAGVAFKDCHNPLRRFVEEGDGIDTPAGLVKAYEYLMRHFPSRYEDVYDVFKIWQKDPEFWPFNERPYIDGGAFTWTSSEWSEGEDALMHYGCRNHRCEPYELVRAWRDGVRSFTSEMFVDLHHEEDGEEKECEMHF